MKGATARTAKKGFEVTRIDGVTFAGARAGDTNSVCEYHEDGEKSGGICEEDHGAGPSGEDGFIDSLRT